MLILNAFMNCLSSRRTHNSLYALEFANEKSVPYSDNPDTTDYAIASARETAVEIISLLAAPDLSITQDDLNTRISRIISKGREKQVQANTTWWARKVAHAVFDGLYKIVKTAEDEGVELGGATGNAITPAKESAEEFAKAHPVLVSGIATLIVLGLLVLITPTVLELLGFVAEGPVAESLAAAWQRTYPDVPYGSLFSRLQSLASRYGKSLR